MRDIRLVVKDDGVILHGSFIQMSELPSVGEFIRTIYFQNTSVVLEKVELFKVEKIIHHYVDDMSRTDYTEIVLSVEV